MMEWGRVREGTLLEGRGGHATKLVGLGTTGTHRLAVVPSLDGPKGRKIWSLGPTEAVWERGGPGLSIAWPIPSGERPRKAD